MRKIVVVSIGVFGVRLKQMQVHLTLMLVFAVIMFTAVVKPYSVQVLQRMEIGSLSALIGTVWVAAVFTSYPYCEEKGQRIAWCETLSVLIGSANVLVIIVIVVTFFRVKGVANCLDICLGVVRKRHRVVSQAVSQRITDLIDRMGGEAVVAARKKVRERSVEQGMESPSVVMFDNPSANIELQNYMSQKQSRDDDAQEEDSTPSMLTHGAPGGVVSASNDNEDSAAMSVPQQDPGK